MEDYMQYMKSLRMQISDVEDQASKISVEEQTQMAIIHALEKDLSSAKSTAQQVTDDADQMLKRTVDIRSKIFDKQKLISSFESDYASLAETLELVEQERISLSVKLLGRRMYYSELRDEMNSKLLQKQIAAATNAETIEAEERFSGEGHGNYLEAFGKQKLVGELETAKSDLVSENDKQESKAMDMTTSEDEYTALSSDKKEEKENIQRSYSFKLGD